MEGQLAVDLPGTDPEEPAKTNRSRDLKYEWEEEEVYLEYIQALFRPRIIAQSLTESKALLKSKKSEMEKNP